MAEVVDDSMPLTVTFTGSEDPDPECVSGETYTKTCSDGSVIVTYECVNGRWSATGNVCPEEDPDPEPDPDPDDNTETLIYILIAGMAAVVIYLLMRR